jgi:phosphoglycolate phosphatase
MKSYNDYFYGLKVLVYDFDGVIVDTSTLKTETFRDIFLLYPKFFEKIWNFHLENKGISRKTQFKHLVCNLIGDKGQRASKHINKLMQIYKSKILPKLINVKYIDGSYKTIRYTNKKFSTYIVSNAPTNELKLIINKKKIGNYFKKIFSSETGINKSQALNKILKIEKIPPECLLFIGDTFKDQIHAKKSLVKFVGLHNNFSNFIGDYGIIIKKMNELYIRLNKIN